MKHVYANGAGSEWWVAESPEEASELSTAAEKPGQHFHQVADTHVLLVKTVDGPPAGKTCAMWAEASPKGLLFTADQLFT